MIRRPPRSTQSRSSAASDVYKRQTPDSARVTVWKEKKMPKVSKATARHQGFPGYVDAYEQEIGDWTVSIESNLIDMDEAPLFKGAPNDQCQANHLGYVLKGKFGIRRRDGVEEIFEAGDAFIIEPGPVSYTHLRA